MESKPFTVLVAEDDPHDLQVITLAFEENGVAQPVQRVNSGKEAIAYVSGTGKYADRSCFPYPSFVLTDLNMPNGDGFSLLRFLKSSPEHAILPTLVLSGSSESEQIRKAYLLGASAYLVKPVGFNNWKNLIKALLDFCQHCEAPRS